MKRIKNAPLPRGTREIRWAGEGTVPVSGIIPHQGGLQVKSTAIYIRVSTDRQAKEGDSVPAQREALNKYIKDHPNMVLYSEYIDDGISGTKFSERDELQRLLKDVSERKIDVIIFTKMDRWFRSVRHYTATQEILDKYGVTWTAIWEPVFDTSSPAGRLIINSMMSIAQFEAENTGSRIRQVMDYKRKHGEVLSGNVPFGYRIENKHLVPDGERAEIALETFKTYSRTSSIDETGRIMSGTGIPSHKTSLNAMLRNQTYIGRHNGLEDYCEPIIPEDLFDDVQRKLKMNIKTKKTKHTYIFSGLIRCGCCGKKMAGTTRRKEQKKYRCEYNYIADCENNHHPKEKDIEEYILQNIRDLIGEELRPRKYEIEQDQEPDRAKQIDAIRRRMDRLKELYINELIDIETYKADLNRYRSQLDELNQEPQKRDLSALKAILQLDIESIYKTLSEAEKRRFWRGFVDHISIDKTGGIAVFFL